MIAILAPVRQTAARHVDAFWEARVPLQMRGDVRLECEVRGNAITIVERRAAWLPEYGPRRSSLEVAQLRSDAQAST